MSKSHSKAHWKESRKEAANLNQKGGPFKVKRDQLREAADWDWGALDPDPYLYEEDLLEEDPIYIQGIKDSIQYLENAGESRAASLLRKRMKV